MRAYKLAHGTATHFLWTHNIKRTELPTYKTNPTHKIATNSKFKAKDEEIEGVRSSVAQNPQNR
jgi:hypothetical protein